MVIEDTSEGLEGKFMLQNVVRDVYWRITLIARRIKAKFSISLKKAFYSCSYIAHGLVIPVHFKIA
jgi:hypothetical protein